MKKIILIALTLFGINKANAQWKDGDNTTTNGTSKGNKVAERTDTFYIPKKEADGQEIKYATDNKTKDQSAQNSTAATKQKNKQIKNKARVDSTGVK